MLTSFDDYPCHQTSDPVGRPASSDPNHYDRYFFNGYTRDSSVFFAVAMGLYPNRQVIDASFSVIEHDGHDGVQSSVNVSGRAPTDRRHTAVGPIKIDVIEPLHQLKVTVTKTTELGLAAELTFTSRTAAIEEPKFERTVDNRVFFDYTRLTQFGTWHGWIEISGRRHVIDTANTWGCRDRSWGIRPVGEQLNTGAPTGIPQFYWLWGPTNFDDCAMHFSVNETDKGVRWHYTASRSPLGAGEHSTYRDARQSIEWTPGTRHAASATVELHHHVVREGVTTLAYRPLYPFYMLGIGYGHPTYSHGRWHGDVTTNEEQFNLRECHPSDPKHFHIQALCEVTMTLPDGAKSVGQGILEQFVIGAHDPSRLTGIIDVAL